MRKLGFILVLIPFILTLVGCGPTATLTIYAPADFISLSAINSFEQQNRINVTLNTYDSPDETYQRLTEHPNAYDLIIVPNYIIDRMKLEDTLMSIDFQQIPNFSLIDEEFKVQGERFTVPYMMTTLGILYNTDKVVDEADVNSWNVLWNPRYLNSVIMTANIRETTAIGLIASGYSMNSKTFYHIDVARVALQKQGRFPRWYQSIDARVNMVANRAAVAVVHSHEAQRAISQNPALNFVIPQEGSAKVIHSFAVPQTTRNSDMAMRFINHMSRTDVATQNAQVVQGRSANREVRALLPAELRDSEVMYPSQAQLARCSLFDYDVAAMRMYQQAWLQVRAAR